jgi:hypothetical protein
MIALVSPWLCAIERNAPAERARRPAGRTPCSSAARCGDAELLADQPTVSTKSVTAFGSSADGIARASMTTSSAGIP